MLSGLRSQIAVSRWRPQSLAPHNFHSCTLAVSVAGLRAPCCTLAVSLSGLWTPSVDLSALIVSIQTDAVKSSSRKCSARRALLNSNEMTRAGKVKDVESRVDPTSVNQFVFLVRLGTGRGTPRERSHSNQGTQTAAHKKETLENGKVYSATNHTRGAQNANRSDGTQDNTTPGSQQRTQFYAILYRTLLARRHPSVPERHVVHLSTS